LIDKKGYFKDSTISLDKYTNREFRTLWNKALKNDIERDGTLTKTGKILVFILNKIEKDHCLLSITEL
jgi:hypothetical protein